jgi:hypothetical protein
MGQITALIFTLMGAPDATDMGVEVYSFSLDSFNSEAQCEEAREALQNKNPTKYYWCK